MTLPPTEPIGETSVVFLSRATDYTKMVVDDDTIHKFLEGLTAFPKNDRLWIKAHAYFEGKSPEAGYNVIARAYIQNPGNQEIVEIFASSSVQMGINLTQNGNEALAKTYFEDAERVYFDLTKGEGWPVFMGHITELYEAWGKDEEVETASRAFSEPFDIEAIRVLADRRNMLDINVTINAVHGRVSGLPKVDALVPEQG